MGEKVEGTTVQDFFGVKKNVLQVDNDIFQLKK